MHLLNGLIAATFTPMNAEGRINTALIPEMVEHLIGRGITGMYVCGSTGEGPSLSSGERETVAAAFVEAADGRIPVVVQVGHNSLEEARRLASHAVSIGADAVSAVSPSYFVPENVSTLVDTFVRIADAAPELPFYYYHIPRFSGLSLSLTAFLEMASARIPSLAGVKFSSREVEVMQQCLAFEEGRYNVLFGVDEMLLSGVVAGCHGAVGSTYNFLAPLFHQVMAHLKAGDLSAAQACQLRASEIIALILRYHGPSGIKAAMSLSGVPCGPPRLPLTALTETEYARLRDELSAMGLFACIEGEGC